jgi:hypothetical protein
LKGTNTVKKSLASLQPMLQPPTAIRDVGTHPMTPKQCLEQRSIFEDGRGKVLSKKSLIMNELRQK